MTNPDLQSLGDTGDDRRDSSQCVSAIMSDFAALAAIFERQLEALSASDDEARPPLIRAKEAAERGTRLAQRLIEQMQASDPT